MSEWIFLIIGWLRRFPGRKYTAAKWHNQGWKSLTFFWSVLILSEWASGAPIDPEKKQDRIFTNFDFYCFFVNPNPKNISK